MRSRRPPHTVLVVEDDDGLRGLYASVLKEAGFSVVAVSDGLDALRAIETATHLPAAVVLDVALPRLSGRDVTQELRSSAHTRRIPIVVVTGTTDPRIEALDVECVLHKPVLPERLVEIVEHCIRRGASVLH